MVSLTQSVWLQMLAALLTGALLTQAFAPLNVALLAILCPAILMLLWHRQSARRALALGYAFGLGYFGIGVSWVYNSIHEFGHAPAAFAAFLTLLFVLVMSLYPALCGWLQAKLRLRSDLLHFLLLLPALWMLLEWARGWVLSGFPWLQLGYSQLTTPLAGFGPLGGVLSITWLVLIQSGAAALLVLGRGWRKRTTGVAGILLVFAVSALVQRLEFTSALPQSLSYAMVQGNIAQAHKWDRDWLLPTVDRYETATLQHLDKDVVIWPEVALPGLYQMFDRDVLQPLHQKVRDAGSTMIFGILKRSDQGIHNAIVSKGEGEQTYFKRHLVPFGEFIPLRSTLTWLGDMVELPADDITAGDEPTLLQIGKVRVASSICYEDAYGNEVIDMLPAANLLVNISNDAWFGDSLAPHQHLEIARMRALESGRPMLRTTNTGVSAVVDHRGRLLDRGPQFDFVVMTGEITPRSGETPYVRYGNLPVVSLAAALLLLSVLLLRKRRR